MRPKISVIIISYNHAPYIARAIQSVLDQTLKDFELIIADDASEDGSPEIIRNFHDSRIRTIFRPRNVGTCMNFNLAFKEARGAYIACLSSDDVYLPTKLEKQAAILDAEENIGAVFTHVEIINKNDRPYKIHPLKYFKRLFNQSNRSRYEWLNILFQNNCLGFQGVLIRRGALENIGGLDARLFTYPDYEWCIRLCIAGYEVHVIPEELTLFRRMPRGTNMSAKNLSVYNRGRFEQRKLLRNFLKISDMDEFKRVFNIEIANASNDLIPYYIACEALKLATRTHREFALDVLYEFLADEEKVKQLQVLHNFNIQDFYRLTVNNSLGYPASLGEWIKQALMPPVSMALHDLACGFLYKKKRRLSNRLMKWAA